MPQSSIRGSSSSPPPPRKQRSGRTAWLISIFHQWRVLLWPFKAAIKWTFRLEEHALHWNLHSALNESYYSVVHKVETENKIRPLIVYHQYIADNLDNLKLYIIKNSNTNIPKKVLFSRIPFDFNWAIVCVTVIPVLGSCLFAKNNCCNSFLLKWVEDS